MTINKLIKELQKLEKQYGSRIQVSADTRVLRSTCNDVFDIVNISRIEPTYVYLCDGDGYQEMTQKCTERGGYRVVLK